MIDNEFEKSIDSDRSMSDVQSTIDFASSMGEVTKQMNKTLLHTDEMVLDIMRHLTLGTGKNLRALMLLISAMDAAGNVPQSAITGAAALEILHMATLVHDDVIDDAETRRGLASVQSKFGKKEAVITGDYLFCRCFAMVAEISSHYPDKFKDFTMAMTKICLGELQEIKHQTDTDLSIRSYLKIIAGKTAALFSLAMYTGAILGGDPEKTARKMAKIGFHIGMSFQIADDCADYEADTEKAKKTVKRDLTEGVITLPLIYAFHKNPALKEQVQSQNLNAAEMNEIIHEVIHMGGVSMAENMADRYFKKAEKDILSVQDLNKREKLMEILNKLSKNDKGQKSK
jgi:heptaprenyl diphosphate synthase